MSSDPSEPLVSVIIVNYNGMDVIEDCLRSVFAQPYRPIEVIVVDNNSTDGSVERIRDGFPEVRLLVNDSNIGFAGGNNRGVGHATGDFVVLLNNDTVVETDWLRGHLDVIQRPNIGAVASKVITDGVPERFYEMNGTINYLGYNIMRQFPDLTQIFFAAGTSVMFRKHLVGRPFLDEYFLYHEDVFLSWRLRIQGYDIRMSQVSVVRHKGSVTTRRQSPSRVTFYQERNKLLNALLFFERRTLACLVPYFIFDGVAKTLMSLFTGRRSLAGIVRSYWWCVSNMGWVRDRRREVQQLRKVPDGEILRLMSCKVADGEGWCGRFFNRLSVGYASAVGLDFHD